MRKVFIGLPSYGLIHPYFVQCLLAIQAVKPLRAPDGTEIQLQVQMCCGDGVARARNQLTADFLASDCTHLLFIDTDLIFSASHLVRIVTHGEPVVGGLYPKKQEGPIEWVLNTLPPDPALAPALARRPDARGLHKVRYIGTGFLCIERAVFEVMIDKHPEARFNGDYGKRREEHDLWPMGVYEYKDGHRRYLSEDWYFCQRWLDMGGEVFADTRIILQHIGTAIFPLQTQKEELFGSMQKSLPSPPLGRPDPGSGGRADSCIGRPVASPGETELQNLQNEDVTDPASPEARLNSDHSVNSVSIPT